MRISIILLIMALVACQKQKPKSFYFGGQIINPLTKNIFIRYKNNIIDTLPVDSNGKFGGYIKMDEVGVYEMVHGNDNERFFVEFNDSLLIFANTLEFQESTYFTGKGADVNNFYFEYKQMEENRPTSIMAYSYLEEPEFLHLIDSAQISRTEMYESFKLKNEVSSNFDTYIKEYINLPFYTFKEIYPVLRHENSGNPEFEGVKSKNYYEYRTIVPIYENSKNQELMVEYLFARLTNETATVFFNKENKDMGQYFETKMQTLEKMDVPKSMKQELAKKMLMSELQYNVDSKELLGELGRYQQFIYDKEAKEELSQMVKTYDYVKSNGVAPSIQLISSKNDTVELKDVLSPDHKKWVLVMNDALTDQRLNQELCNAVDMAVSNNPKVQIIVLLLEESLDRPGNWKSHYNLNTSHETFFVISQRT